jgi:predicted small integral membrane protein
MTAGGNVQGSGSNGDGTWARAGWRTCSPIDSRGAETTWITAAECAVSASRPPRWTALGSLPVVIGVFVVLNAGYIMLVAFGNITDFATNQAFVSHVLTMDTTNFGGKPGTGLDPNVMWRKISVLSLQNAGYVCIILWESIAGLVLTAATACWFVDRGTSYARARALSTIGLLMIIALFGGGFIDIGGEWFQMWRSTSWNGLDTAFRNVVLASLPLILIHLPVTTWRRPTARDFQDDS